MGFGVASSSAVDGYATRLVLGEFLPGVNQPQFSVERKASEFAAGSKSELNDAVIKPQIGLQLRSYQSTPRDLDELSAAQAGILSVGAGTATVASNVVERNRSGGRDPIAAFTPLSGFFMKTVEASGSWTAGLSGGPTIPLDLPDVSWMFSSTSNQAPDSDFTIRFFVPAEAARSGGTFLLFRFPGPAGQIEGQSAGTGDYLLKLRMDGFAELDELLASGSRVRRHVFRFADANAVGGRAHFISINNNARDEIGYPGTRIVFTPLGPINPSSVADTLATVAAEVLRQNPDAGAGSLYNVPVPKSGTRPAAVAQKVWFGARNTIRVSAQVSVHRYVAEGFCITDDVALPFPLRGSARIAVTGYGYVPTGTGLEVRLFDAETDTELSGRSVEWATEAGQRVTYDSSDDLRRVYAKFEMTSNVGRTKTPTIQTLEIWRNGQVATPAGEAIVVPFRPSGTSLVARTVTRWAWEGPTREASGETCQIEVIDSDGSLATRLNQGRIPARIEVKHTAAGVDYVPVWCGYVTAKNQRIVAGFGGTDQAIGYSLVGEGEWTRLDRAKFFDKKTWFELDSPAEPRPWKVTEAIKYCLYMAYPASMVNIPDRDLRIWTVDGDGYVTEPGASAYEVASELAMSYFGAILVFDPSAGTYGQWRMIEKALPTDPPLVRFESGAQPGTYPHHWVDSWGNLGSPIGGQTVKRIPCQNVSEDISPPEGSRVMVVGGVVGNTTGDGGAANRLWAEAPNVNGYDPLLLGPGHPNAPDPTHPDYLGYPQTILIVDASLSTQQAVDTVTRRVFDLACHAYTTAVVDAPVWLVTNANDPDQDRPRPLRVRDRVRLSYLGETRDFLVASVSFRYDSDEMPRADYTLVRTSMFDTQPEVPRMAGPLDTLQSIARGSLSAKVFGFFGFVGSRQVQALGAGALTNLAPAPADPIQDLTPGSPTFGEFTGPPGYV